MERGRVRYFPCGLLSRVIYVFFLTETGSPRIARTFFLNTIHYCPFLLFSLMTLFSLHQVYCHMYSTGEVWTLIARFSNNDTNNWMKQSGDWWYDTNVTNGKTTDPSNNFDMISSAFWLVIGNEFKITRSDDSQHTALLQTTGDCLGGQTFRSKITSYGDFRNGTTWRLNERCLGNCTVQYGGQYETTNGFNRAKCNGTILSADKIGFWCDKGTWDGSVMMVGGGGGVCLKTDHGIGLSVAKPEPSFISIKGRVGRDFGDAAYGNTTKVYSLNLWLRQHNLSTEI